MTDVRLIGEEITVDGQLVGIIVPHAKPGPRDDFEQLLRDIETGGEPVNELAVLVDLEARIDKLPLIGGMVPMAALLDALKEVKRAA